MKKSETLSQLLHTDLKTVFENPGRPCVLKGIASSWPAVRKWSFLYLSELNPTLPIKLVVGNREINVTRFTDSTLGEYLKGLHHPPVDDEPHYLKEFDLLKKFPQLKNDLRISEIFPPTALVGTNLWIGPAKAHTGLHYDYLPNIAMLINGRKRFYLAAPGCVEKVGGVSDKYDRWAKLSRVSFEYLVKHDFVNEYLYTVDLLPGDALYIPAGWWHEVVNFEPSILLSGFFGTKLEVIARWMYTGALDCLHKMDLWSKGNCTCHIESPSLKR
jgi:hypothetical protein